MGKYVTINTLEDLTELCNQNWQAIEKHLTKLGRRNRKLTLFAVAAIGCVVWSEIQRRKQEEQLYRLSVRVKDLERGEEA